MGSVEDGAMCDVTKGRQRLSHRHFVRLPESTRRFSEEVGFESFFVCVPVDRLKFSGPDGDCGRCRLALGSHQDIQCQEAFQFKILMKLKKKKKKTSLSILIHFYCQLAPTSISLATVAHSSY